jgi:hypothetical protein
VRRDRAAVDDAAEKVGDRNRSAAERKAEDNALAAGGNLAAIADAAGKGAIDETDDDAGLPSGNRAAVDDGAAVRRVEDVDGGDGYGMPGHRDLAAVADTAQKARVGLIDEDSRPTSRDHAAVGDAAAGGRIAKDGHPGEDNAILQLGRDLAAVVDAAGKAGVELEDLDAPFRCAQRSAVGDAAGKSADLPTAGQFQS